MWMIFYFWVLYLEVSDNERKYNLQKEKIKNKKKQRKNNIINQWELCFILRYYTRKENK